MPQSPLIANVARNPATKAAVALKVDPGTGALVVTQDSATNTYVECAASGNQTLGGNGTIGDFLDHLVISPVTVGAGNVSIKDGNTSLPIFVNGGNLSDTKPFTVTVGATSANAGWVIQTGGNVTCLAIGEFKA